MLLAGPLAFRRHNPVSSFTVAPGSGPPPLMVAVDGSASVGAHGTITDYAWDWGDGSGPDTTVTASHSYAATGTYAITLKVTESTGLTGTSTQTVNCISAGNSPPAATIDSATPAGGDAPLDVSFFGHGTDAAPPADVLEHRWSFGDGSPDLIIGGMFSGQIAGANHTYAQPGSYVCTLTVRDSEGILSSAVTTIIATAGGVPFAAFSATPQSGPPPFLVGVDGSASFDANGSVTSWSWDWGDGSPATTGVTSSHTYATTGTFIIRLAVTDNSGLTAWVEHSVNSISAGNISPSGIIVNAIPQSGPAPLNIAFLGFGHDDTGPLEHRWDFGDGSPLLYFPIVVNHGTSSASHTYALPGTYVCSLRVKDPENITSTTTFSVTVDDPATSPERLGGGVCGSTGLEALVPLLLLLCRRRRTSP
ncbi:MAG: PKD domain-containing protein [Planctomycetes bacterium]|nr:PKD domain-containing protein [Planctomycetota bacterium]